MPALKTNESEFYASVYCLLAAMVMGLWKRHCWLSSPCSAYLSGYRHDESWWCRFQRLQSWEGRHTLHRKNRSKETSLGWCCLLQVQAWPLIQGGVREWESEVLASNSACSLCEYWLHHSLYSLTEHQRRPPATSLCVWSIHLCLPFPQHLEAAEPNSSSGRTVMCLLKEFLQKPQELSTNRLPGSGKGHGDARGVGCGRRGQWHIFAIQSLWQKETYRFAAVTGFIPLPHLSISRWRDFCLSSAKWDRWQVQNCEGSHQSEHVDVIVEDIPEGFRGSYSLHGSSEKWSGPNSFPRVLGSTVLWCKSDHSCTEKGGQDWKQRLY